MKNTKNLSYENGITVLESWGRKISFNNSVFPKSIISQNKELLTSPIRIVGKANNEEIIWNDEGCLYLADIKEQCIINGFAVSKWLVLNTSYVLDESGGVKFDIKISPVGRSEQECFGVVESSNLDRSIQELFLEIPLAKDLDLYDIRDFWNTKQITDLHNNKVRNIGKITDSGLKSSFKPSVTISNGSVGLNIATESDKNWFLSDENDAIEVVKTQDSIVLRFKLMTKNPSNWTDDSQIWSPQICYRFYMTPTPVKEADNKYANEKIVHLGCFEHIKDEQDYYSFLNEKYNESETNFDHIVNSGCTTLILHEKWNTMQNYWHYDQYSMDSLMALVKKCHKKHIKVLVYFGFEITSITHDFTDLYGHDDEFIRENVQYCDWYRTPYQRATPVCRASNRMKENIEGILKTIDLFNLDGVYLDGTATPRPCFNHNHGCGFIADDGKMHPTFSIQKTKDVIKQICDGVHKRHGRVDVHCSGLTIPYITYHIDSIWYGEDLQTILRDAEDKRFVFDTLRANSIGIYLEMIAFNLREDWGIKQALAYCLPCGIYPRANSIYQPLDVIKPIWKMTSDFKILKSKFVGFWENTLFTSNNENIVISYYENKGNYLIYVSNPTNSKQTFKLSCKNVGQFKCLNKDLCFSDEITLDKSEIVFFKN